MSGGWNVIDMGPQVQEVWTITAVKKRRGIPHS